MMMMITRIIFFGRDVRTYAKARYTLATKLNSTQSTLLKVDRVALAPYTPATKLTISATKLNVSATMLKLHEY